MWWVASVFVCNIKYQKVECFKLRKRYLSCIDILYVILKKNFHQNFRVLKTGLWIKLCTSVSDCFYLKSARACFTCAPGVCVYVCVYVCVCVCVCVCDTYGSFG